MSFLDRISVLILTHNEAPNIGRVLDALKHFPEVVVLDSGSTDETLDIVSRYPNARTVIRPFDSHAVQWNYGLTACGLARPWVLALDADYVLPVALVDEIAALQPHDAVGGYRVGFRYCIDGEPLTGTLYQPHVALYRRDRGAYVQGGHTQRIAVTGRIESLRGRIDHDDRKPLSRWLAAQQRYAALEADHLMSAPRASLRMVDRIRRMGWLAPPAALFLTLFAKRCILDGRRGLLYALQRTLAELLIAIEVVQRRLQRKS
jgi:glycosyltransferase involved in cell wall biosynthesis